MVDVGGELSLALDSNVGHTNYHQAGNNYDFFYAVVAGGYHFGTGPKWVDGIGAGSNTARGTGAGSTEIEIFEGRLVNKNALVLRHGGLSADTVNVPARQATLLGAARMIAHGQTEDSAKRRFIANIYNVTSRPLACFDPAASWTYTTAAWRQANGSASNKVEVLFALGGGMLDIIASALIGPSVNGANRAGIGVDVTNANLATLTGITAAASPATSVNAVYRGCPGMGYHYAAPLEYGSGSGITTWFGDSGTDLYRSGLSGSVLS